MPKLVNARKMLQAAKKGKYAVPHININNLEWAKAVLISANEEKSPLIIGASEGAIRYMGGYKTVANLVANLYEELEIKIPVALHLDHGTFEGCKKAIEAGFTSVMFDGSSLEFAENLYKTKEIVKLAKPKNISVEAEVGSIGGEEDGNIGEGEIADKDEAKQLKDAGIDVLAAGIGNIHGPYPSNWKSLNFDVLKEIVKYADIGIVLHGGSGIPLDQVKKAISLGVTKINVNTELQLVFKEATKKFVLSGEIDQGKNYDPRKILKPGCEAIKLKVKDIIKNFGSKGKA